jgi:hypothetical protein
MDHDRFSKVELDPQDNTETRLLHAPLRLLNVEKVELLVSKLVKLPKILTTVS